MQPYFNCTGLDPATQTPIYSTSSYNPASPTTCSTIIATTDNCDNPVPPYRQYRGACQAANAELAPHIFDSCALVMPAQVWVPADWPKIQTYFDILLGNTFAGVVDSYPVTPLHCHEHMLSLSCTSQYSTCTEVLLEEFNVYVGVRHIPCQSLCNETLEICADFFRDSRLDSSYIPDCTSSSYAPDSFPMAISNNQTIIVDCIPTAFPPSPYQPYHVVPVETCPAATGHNTRFVENGLAPCTLKCPDASYSDSEWTSLNQITTIGASLSVFCMCFLICSYLLKRERRKFPANLHVWQFVATLLFACGFLINGSNPQKDVWCFDEGTYATQSNVTACGVQGFFFIFFGLALTAWCFVIAAIMFYGIVFNNRLQNLQKFLPFYHLFAWGGPLAFAIAALASKSIAYGPPLAWCFVHFAGFGYDDGAVSRDYPLFSVLFVPILGMFLATVTKIIYVKRLNAPHAAVKSGSRFKAQIRVLILSLMIFFITFSIFEWRLQINTDEVNSVGVQWSYCKVKKSLDLIVKETCDGTTNPARISYSHTAFESFVLSGLGVIIFIGFGADLNLYTHWVEVFKLLFAGKWRELHGFVVFGRHPSNYKGRKSTSISTPTDSKNSNSGSGSASRSEDSQTSSSIKSAHITVHGAHMAELPGTVQGEKVFEM